MMIPTIVTFVIYAVLGTSAAQHVHPPAAATPTEATTALSTAVIQQLLAGEGMGLAKPAELNNYPGPKHVLDKKAALELTPAQESKVRDIYQQMLDVAKALGAKIVAAERSLDEAFGKGTMSEKELAQRIKEIAELQGDLRIAHLKAHLAMTPVLSAEQVRKYYDQADGR